MRWNWNVEKDLSSHQYQQIRNTCTFCLQIIGSSLLLMHDKQNKAGIWMIDFATTLRVEGRKLSHRAPWVVGNHEDGYLTGVAHLTEVRF